MKSTLPFLLPMITFVTTRDQTTSNSSALRFRTLPLRLKSSISSAVANFASACNLC